MDKSTLNRIFQGLFFSCFFWIYASIISTNSGNKPWLSVLVGIVILIRGVGIAYFCKTVVTRWNQICITVCSITLVGIRRHLPPNRTY